MKKQLSCIITATGRVQGVGFRPWVCRLAKEMGIAGSVKNEGGVVEIQAKGSEDALLLFMQKIREAKAPKLVEQLTCKECADISAKDFRAVESSGEARAPLFPADLAVCEDCVAELVDSGNRRHGYPYISCTACGPRYTMIKALPYDRERTTMEKFPLCSNCAKEYTDEADRRCHAESISCRDCGPQLLGLTREGKQMEKESAMAEAISLVKAGAIILVKGLGGYQLVCRGDVNEAVRRLRGLKHREGKPFALMVSSIEEAEKLVEISEIERDALTSAVRPILLSKRRAPVSPCVADKVPRLGVMLPSTGFYALLTGGVGAPVVVTSANESGRPMIYKDEDAKKFLEAHEEIAGLFGYDREILRPADDSVMQRNGSGLQLIRRTRGFLPEPAVAGGAGAVLALGADMAPGFCLGGGRFYPAEVPCDLTAEGAAEHFLETEKDWEKLLGITPKAIVCDKHPRYVSRTLAEKMSAERNLPLYEVQHHHAHALSVMAEHGLKERALAFVFDGTGYGDDGTIWGGEILLCEGISMKRVGHLKPVPMIGGDLSMQQAWKTALCYLADAGLPAGDPRYSLVRAAISHGVNTIGNSSMGRLFDAAAALLGIAEENRYKGECPMALEAAAAKAIGEGRRGNTISWSGKEKDGRLLWDPRPLIEALVARRGTIEEKALAFHEAIVKMIVDSASYFQEKSILLSGGCFLNQILMTRAKVALEAQGYKVYTNEKLPPGDGGVSLGQGWYGALK